MIIHECSLSDFNSHFCAERINAQAYSFHSAGFFRFRMQQYQPLLVLLVELAQLVEQPIRQLQGKRDAWLWRDWLVVPLAGDRWRLQRSEAGSGQS